LGIRSITVVAAIRVGLAADVNESRTTGPTCHGLAPSAAVVGRDTGTTVSPDTV
jgi:hypothetical protein